MTTEVFTYDYFLDEFNRFNELLGKRSTTQEIALNAWKGLCYGATKCSERSNTEQKRIIDSGLLCANENLVRRLPYYSF